MTRLRGGWPRNRGWSKKFFSKASRQARGPLASYRMGTTGEVPWTWSSPLPSCAESKMGGATCIRPRSTISLHGVALNHSHELYFHFGSFSKTPTSVEKCRFQLHYLELEMRLRKFSAEVFFKIPWKMEFIVQKWFQSIFRERGDTQCPDSTSSITPPYSLWNTQQLLHTPIKKKKAD